MTVDIAGLFMCGKYAFAPNYYHYCGPEKQQDLREYLLTRTTDKGLTGILSSFETLYPYLILIASANGIRDPFDRRVVDAYWIGNSFIDAVSRTSYYRHISESLGLQKKLSSRVFHGLVDERMEHLTPTHVSHVLELFFRTGREAVPHTLHTMDECRISWGRVIALQGESLEKSVPGTVGIFVERRPLVYRHDTLQLGKPERYRAYTLGDEITVGQWVSLHWGIVCDVLANDAVRRLATYTKQALRFAKRGSL